MQRSEKISNLMSKEFRIVILDDNPGDAALMEAELKRDGIPFASVCVDSQTTFEQALREFAPDMILSDHTLPGFSGEAALAIAK